MAEQVQYLPRGRAERPGELPAAAGLSASAISVGSEVILYVSMVIARIWPFAP